MVSIFCFRIKKSEFVAPWSSGIERNWGRLMRMLPKESDVALQDAAFNTIGDMVSEAARNGCETGFRAAFRFMMSL